MVSPDIMYITTLNEFLRLYLYSHAFISLPVNCMSVSVEWWQLKTKCLRVSTEWGRKHGTRWRKTQKRREMTLQYFNKIIYHLKRLRSLKGGLIKIKEVNTLSISKNALKLIRCTSFSHSRLYEPQGLMKKPGAATGKVFELWSCFKSSLKCSRIPAFTSS